MFVLDCRCCDEGTFDESGLVVCEAFSFGWGVVTFGRSVVPVCSRVD